MIQELVVKLSQSGIQRAHVSCHQQTGFKFKEECSKVLDLEHSIYGGHLGK
jgi:hypothetical protein